MIQDVLDSWKKMEKIVQDAGRGRDTGFLEKFSPNGKRAVTKQLETAWKALQKRMIKNDGLDLPDLILILSEAQALRASWASDEPSYLRSYLSNGIWGKNDAWDSIARQFFEVFLGMFVMPPSLAEDLLVHLQRREKLPRIGFSLSVICRMTMYYKRTLSSSMTWQKKPARP